MLAAAGRRMGVRSDSVCGCPLLDLVLPDAVFLVSHGAFKFAVSGLDLPGPSGRLTAAAFGDLGIWCAGSAKYPNLTRKTLANHTGLIVNVTRHKFMIVRPKKVALLLQWLYDSIFSTAAPSIS
jgi:hypothetical protein